MRGPSLAPTARVSGPAISDNRAPAKSHCELSSGSVLKKDLDFGSSEKHRNFLTCYIAIWQYNHMAMDTPTDRLSLVFSALADPTRRAILARHASGDADVSELMKPFPLRQPTISKHLGVLERAGLVMRNYDAQRRPRTLVAVPLRDVADWVEPFRRFWEQKFVSLDGYLKEMQKKEKARGRKRR